MGYPADLNNFYFWFLGIKNLDCIYCKNMKTSYNLKAMSQTCNAITSYIA